MPIYYAVIHGDPSSDQTFAPMRTRPVKSQVVFEFEAPALETDQELSDYFAEQFLPLRVVFHRGEQQVVSDSTFEDRRWALAEAKMFASTLRTLEADVRISTKDGREICRATLA